MQKSYQILEFWHVTTEFQTNDFWVYLIIKCLLHPLFQTRVLYVKDHFSKITILSDFFHDRTLWNLPNFYYSKQLNLTNIENSNMTNNR